MIFGRQLIAICLFAPGHIALAQLPHVAGSWKLNGDASIYPGPLPQSEVRTYAPLDDGFLLGLAITVDAEGRASFLQFAAKPDGREYPEYSPSSLAALQISGDPTTATYSEISRDEYTVEWVDSQNGEPLVSGTRRVSEDGETLTIEFALSGPDGESQEFRLVYERL